MTKKIATCIILSLLLSCSNSQQLDSRTPGGRPELSRSQIRIYEKLGESGMGWAYRELDINNDFYGDQINHEKYSALALINNDSESLISYAEFILSEANRLDIDDQVRRSLVNEASCRLESAGRNAFFYPLSDIHPEYGRRTLARIRTAWMSYNRSTRNDVRVTVTAGYGNSCNNP